MVASNEQCRRHIAGAASAVASFSDDSVVQAVLQELCKVDKDRRTGTRPPLVGFKHLVVLLRRLLLHVLVLLGSLWLGNRYLGELLPLGLRGGLRSDGHVNSF